MPRPTPPDTTDTRSFYADPRALRRSRALATFLIANWTVMGVLVYNAGLRSLPGALGFGFGLLAALGAISQLRAGKLARVRPLAEIAEDVLRVRQFTAGTPTDLPWHQIKRLESDKNDHRLLLASGAYHNLPWLALSPEDRESMLQEIRQRLA
jgi:hypothetical protein